MRVAQVTFDGYRNYGNILQKYALQRTLKKFSAGIFLRLTLRNNQNEFIMKLKKGCEEI